MHWYAEGPAKFYFMAGTGKWYGITGAGTIDRTGGERTDGGHMFRYDVEWKVKEGLQTVSGPPGEGPYTNITEGWHFHSPHYTDRLKDPGTGGYLFLHNYQEQKVIVDDPEDPFFVSTGYWQGTRITDLKGDYLMDTGMKSHTRADGDAIWAVCTWWYGQGPGEYRIVGGTGKWKNIRGVGTTLPNTRGTRVDTNHTLNFRFDWTIMD